jgi:hypothetical protein
MDKSFSAFMSSPRLDIISLFNFGSISLCFNFHLDDNNVEDICKMCLFVHRVSFVFILMWAVRVVW